MITTKTKNAASLEVIRTCEKYALLSLTTGTQFFISSANLRDIAVWGNDVDELQIKCTLTAYD